MSTPKRYRRSEADEGPLYRLTMRPVEVLPPSLSEVLECLNDDRTVINTHIAQAMCDPDAKYARVPVSILARFSALANDIQSHLWRAHPELMDEPLSSGGGE